MRGVKKALLPLLLALSLGVPLSGNSIAGSATTSAWNGRSRARMVADALKVAPPVLAHLIAKHADSLRAGLEEATLSEGEAQHRQNNEDPSSGAAAAMGVVAAKAIAALDGHKPMTDLVYHLGVLAHLAADVSDPLLTDPAGSHASFAADFPSYIERNLERFPAVFYGYPEGSSPLVAEAIASAKIARGYYGHLARAYAAAGGSSVSFDVRSIPFGVASLCYSRGVTNIARAWLHVWREAHGDLTGTRYLPGIAVAGGTPSRSPVARAVTAPRRTPLPPSVEGSGGVALRPEAIDPADDLEGTGEGAAVDPNGATITKTIIGKSRKRLSEAARSGNGPPPSDPNKPADPNI
jgi:hypothetical protein